MLICQICSNHPNKKLPTNVHFIAQRRCGEGGGGWDSNAINILGNPKVDRTSYIKWNFYNRSDCNLYEKQFKHTTLYRMFKHATKLPTTMSISFPSTTDTVTVTQLALTSENFANGKAQTQPYYFTALMVKTHT